MTVKLGKHSLILSAIAVLSMATVQGGAVVSFGGITNTLAGNDDGSTAAVGLGIDGVGGINLFGVTSSTVFVNNNGNVTFTSAFGTYTPSGLSSGVGQPIIAPFFADVDTRTGNLVHYGNATYNGRDAFIVNWPSVGYYSEHLDKLNIFQLILTDRTDTGAGNFDIEFNYDQIQWETGDASSGSGGLGGTSVAVGYSNGLSGGSNVFFQLPGSLVNGALLDSGPNSLVGHSLNSNVLGRYDFQVRNGQVISGVPEPATFALLGLGLAGLAWKRRHSARS